MNPELKSTAKQKVSELKNRQRIEDGFGKIYKHNKKYAETLNTFVDQIDYDDGLSLTIAENQHISNQFHIKSKSYALSISGVGIISIGMKTNDFQKIFPKSYSKREIVQSIKGKKGKVWISVFLSDYFDNDLKIEDSRIIFLFNEEGGNLKEIFTYEPS